ncbi:MULTISPECIES: hypothetical protein [Hyphomicrobiales]|uniref:Uncharacterized protein n=1 Tax=Hansschlegelia zhihuaiae TaxID=405005 RepID=A0A4Q0MEM0_9HYPH|nr:MULTISPECIES: hypothetical protein [Hyphomicrobiales]RXF71429.1 hypothetical protein EK403_15220 [Hansschlegelia zhihuaiae]
MDDDDDASPSTFAARVAIGADVASRLADHILLIRSRHGFAAFPGAEHVFHPQYSHGRARDDNKVASRSEGIRPVVYL